MDNFSSKNYKVLSNSERLEAEDKLDRSLSKADAMASMINGERFAGFLNVNDDLKERYVWALHDMIMDAKHARDALNEHHYACRHSS